MSYNRALLHCACCLDNFIYIYYYFLYIGFFSLEMDFEENVVELTQNGIMNWSQLCHL